MPVPRVSVRNSRAKADQPAGGHEVVHPHPAGAVVGHVLHASLARRQQLGDRADVLLGHVDRQALDGLVALAVDLALDHVRLSDRQLEALPAHHLDEHRQLQLAAPLHLVGVRPLGVLDAQRHVADELLVQARADLAGGELVAVFARQRRGVDAERDRHRGLVDGDHRQRARVAEIGERLADRHLGDPRHGDDLPRAGLGRVDAVERVGDVQLGDCRALDRAVGAAPGDLLALADVAVAHAADRQAPDVRRGVEVGHERLQRVLGVVRRRGDALEQQVQQRREVLLFNRMPGVVVQRGHASLCVAVDDRELDLVLVGVEVEEQLVDLVDDLGDARVGAVDLVDDEDHRQLGLERLAQHEARLRQRPLGGVDEQQHAVDHRQPALDLARRSRRARGCR